MHLISNNRIYIFSKETAWYLLKHGDYPLHSPWAERNPTARSVPMLTSQAADWSLAALSPLSQQGDSPERDTLAMCPALPAIQHLFQESLPKIN